MKMGQEYLTGQTPVGSGPVEPNKIDGFVLMGRGLACPNTTKQKGNYIYMFTSERQ